MTPSCLSVVSSWPDCTSSSIFLLSFYTTCTSNTLSISLTNYYAKVPLFYETLPPSFSSDLVITSPFKIKLSEDPEYKYLMFFCNILWTKPATKAELWVIVKDFFQSNEIFSQVCWRINSHSNFSPCFSDLYQLVHMLVGEGWDQHGMNTTNWENLEKCLESQQGVQPVC